jgi:MFS family permease
MLSRDGPAWGWLFLLEGLPAVLVSFVAFWLPDHPETAKFLTEEERLYLKDRLSSGAPKSEKHWDWKSLGVLIIDPTLYTFSLYWMRHSIGGFGIGFSLPTIVYQLGFTNTTYSQLMIIVSPEYPSKRR